MAKLPNKKFHIKSDSGELLRFECQAFVNNSGVFSLRIPQDIPDFRQTIEYVAKLEEHKDVWVEFGREHWSVQGHALHLCEKLMDKAGEEYLKFTETREMVILYKTDAHCHYIMDPEGNFYLSGNDLSDNSPYKYAEDGCQWQGSNSRNRSHFMSDSNDTYFVGVFARAYVKTTKQRGDYIKIEYTNPCHDKVDGIKYGNHDAENYLERLNCAVKLYDSDVKTDRGNLKELPYSEASAKFFYDLLICICKLQHRISNVINDEKILLTAIQNSGQLLLTEGK